MPKKKKQQIISCMIISVVLFAALFLVSFRTRADVPGRQPVEIVIFGDSMIGEVRDERSIPALLREELGKNVYNGAFSGTCAARIEPQDRLDYARDMYSLAELSRSAYSGDFGVQRSIVMKESNTELFAEALDGLDGIDFKRVDVIVIQQGLNDYHAGVPIENPEAPYDDRTFLGTLRTAVSLFRKANPAVRIVLLSPGYAWYLERGQTCEELNFGGGVLEDYVNAELRLSEELDLEFIDVYHDLYSHGEWEDWRIYTREGLHPNDDGRRAIANRLAEQLRHNQPEPNGF